MAEGNEFAEVPCELLCILIEYAENWVNGEV